MNTPKNDELPCGPSWTNAKNARLVEALYSPKTRQTYVRHPENRKVWVEAHELAKICSGTKTKTVVRETVDIFHTFPTPNTNAEEIEGPKTVEFGRASS